MILRIVTIYIEQIQDPRILSLKRGKLSIWFESNTDILRRTRNLRTFVTKNGRVAREALYNFRKFPSSRVGSLRMETSEGGGGDRKILTWFFNKEREITDAKLTRALNGAPPRGISHNEYSLPVHGTRWKMPVAELCNEG